MKAEAEKRGIFWLRGSLRRNDRTVLPGRGSIDWFLRKQADSAKVPSPASTTKLHKE